MTDWTACRKCDVCFAEIGEACLSLSSGGPDALPEVRIDVPHSSRKKRTATAPARALAASRRPAYLKNR